MHFAPSESPGEKDLGRAMGAAKPWGEENVPEKGLSRKCLDPPKELMVCSVEDFCTGKTEH